MTLFALVLQLMAGDWHDGADCPSETRWDDGSCMTCVESALDDAATAGTDWYESYDECLTRR